MISRRLGVAFFPIPKNAGTSIRHALYEIEHGKRFAPEEHDIAEHRIELLRRRGWAPSGEFSTLFTLYPPLFFERVDQQEVAGLLKLVVIRHPIDRVVSPVLSRAGDDRFLRASGSLPRTRSRVF